jgi:hypothetical protein
MDTMDQILAAEDKLGPLQWLVAGYGTSRTRSYKVAYPSGPDDVLIQLDGAMSKHPAVGRFVSSTGIGNDMLAGCVKGPRFEAQFFSPIDVTVSSMAQVRLWGEVAAQPDGTSQVGLSIRPAFGGIVTSVSCLLIAIATFLFGIFQFAIGHEWQSFVVVPSLLLLWAIREGRDNERTLLGRLDAALVSADD